LVNLQEYSFVFAPATNFFNSQQLIWRAVWDLHPHMHIWVITFTFLYKKYSLMINAPQLKHTGDSRPTAK